jgi:hypothetical protein
MITEILARYRRVRVKVGYSHDFREDNHGQRSNKGSM